MLDAHEAYGLIHIVHRSAWVSYISLNKITSDNMSLRRLAGKLKLLDLRDGTLYNMDQ